MNKEAFTALLGALLAGNLAAENLTREQLDKLLAELAEKPAPEAKRMPMAMCYMPAPTPLRAEYVCPQCGEKTIYSREDAWETIPAVRSVPYHRTSLAKLRKMGVDAMLDERALCAVCKTTAGFSDEKPTLHLNVRLNGTTASTPLQNNDWEKLYAFLEGRDEWLKDRTSKSTEPLKPEIPRIRQLLALDPPPEPSTVTPVEDRAAYISGQQVLGRDLLDTAQYTCPDCTSKTLHTSRHPTAVATVRAAQQHRDETKKLRALGVDAVLDERALCDVCKKKTGLSSSTVAFYLDVRWQGKFTRSRLVPNDLRKLLAHLGKQDTWLDENNAAQPLQPELPRVRALLGLKTEVP